MEAAVTALGGYQNLWLQIPHTLVTGHVEIKLVLTMKLVFTVPEAKIQADEGEQSVVLAENCNDEWLSKIEPQRQ